jgi:RNA polymerase sigma factor (sigma-70 family)
MERDLIDRARHGDHEAFAALVTGSIGDLYATARLILRRDDAAEDAVQDALVRAWLGIRALRDPDRFEAWLRRLLVHACYRAAKKDRARQIVEIHELPTDGPAVADDQRSLALRDQLERGFRRLSPEQRAVLVVHHFLDLTDAESADVLGIPVGTMKSPLSRATSGLRAAIEADDRRPTLAEEAAR